MEFKIVERYYTITPTKRSQLCKTEQFIKKIRQHKDSWHHKDKTDKSLTLYLTFRIFDSISHHYTLGAFKKDVSLER